MFRFTRDQIEATYDRHGSVARAAEALRCSEPTFRKMMRKFGINFRPSHRPGVPHEVYVLIDPRTGEVRYVGFAQSARQRLKGHIAEAKHDPEKRSYRIHWIASLLNEGVRPESRVVAIVDSATEAGRLEQGLIAIYRSNGVRLVNGTIGGEGAPGLGWYLTPEAIEKRNKYFASEENRARQSEVSQRHWADPENREHQAEQMRSWHEQEDAESKAARVDKIREAVTGVVYSEASREKMRQAKLGKPGAPRTPEWIAKISAAQKGVPRPQSKATKAKRAAAMARPEVRAKMSAAAKARVRDPKVEARRKRAAAKRMKDPKVRAKIAASMRAFAAAAKLKDEA